MNRTELGLASQVQGCFPSLENVRTHSDRIKKIMEKVLVSAARDGERFVLRAGNPLEEIDRWLAAIPARGIITHCALNDFGIIKSMPFSHLEGTLHASKIF